jgi:hypothetical protein
MWVCAVCTDLLRRAPGAEAADNANPYGDFLVRLQIHLARHVADGHPEAVPEPHTDGCKLCEHYRRRNDGDPANVWAEHRARDLFLPAGTARLL